MSETLIVSIVVGILTIFGGAGFWSYRASRAETPLKQQEHDLSLAVGVNKIIMESLEAVQEDAKELREDLKSIRNELDSVKTELEAERVERRNFARLAELWNIWYKNLSDEWSIHRANDRAPQPPGHKE